MRAKLSFWGAHAPRRLACWFRRLAETGFACVRHRRESSQPRKLSGLPARLEAAARRMMIQLDSSLKKPTAPLHRRKGRRRGFFRTQPQQSGGFHLDKSVWTHASTLIMSHLILLLLVLLGLSIVRSFCVFLCMLARTLLLSVAAVCRQNSDFPVTPKFSSRRTCVEGDQPTQPHRMRLERSNDFGSRYLTRARQLNGRPRSPTNQLNLPFSRQMRSRIAGRNEATCKV